MGEKFLFETQMSLNELYHVIEDAVVGEDISPEAVQDFLDETQAMVNHYNTTAKEW